MRRKRRHEKIIDKCSLRAPCKSDYSLSIIFLSFYYEAQGKYGGQKVEVNNIVTIDEAVS